MNNQELILLLRRISKYQWDSIRWFMSSREHRVISLMCRRPKPTLAKTARELKVTPERIRQIYHKGLRRILWQIKKMKALGEYDFILNPKTELTDNLNCPVNLDLPIDYLDLDCRVRNCFYHTGQKTLREIVSMTENDLLAIKCFGHTSLTHLKNRLAALGLKLREIK